MDFQLPQTASPIPALPTPQCFIALYQINADSLARFEDLPTELRDMILALIFDHQGRIGAETKPIQRWESRSSQPIALTNMEGLLQASHFTRNLATEYIGRQQFVCDANLLADMTRAYGKGHCSRIRRLSMTIKSSRLDYMEEEWPGLIKTLAKRLPSLTELQVSSLYETWKADVPCDETASGDPYGTITRQQQEQRAIIRFGSFVLPSHPTLNRVIKPAHSGPTFEADEELVCNSIIVDRGYEGGTKEDCREWKCMSKWSDATRQERIVEEVSLTIGYSVEVVLTTMQDRVIDAPKVRRLKQVEWATADINDLVMTPTSGASKNNIWHSGTTGLNDVYAIVDERAYRTKEDLRASGLTHRSHDDLVDLCRSAAALSHRGAMRLAIENVELRGELEKTVADLQEKNADLEQSLDEAHYLTDQMRQAKAEFEDQTSQLRQARRAERNSEAKFDACKDSSIVKEEMLRHIERKSKPL